MKSKLKICSVCEKPSVLWQATPKLCKNCAMRSKPIVSKASFKPLTQTTDGETAKPFKVYKTSDHKKVLTYYQKQLKIYAVISKQFIKDHPICQAQIEGCLGKADQVHHMRGRNGYLNDTTTFLACCDSCHRFIEKNVAWAKEKGFSMSRLSKAI